MLPSFFCCSVPSHRKRPHEVERGPLWVGLCQSCLSHWLKFTSSSPSHRWRATDGSSMTLNYFIYWLYCSALLQFMLRVGVCSRVVNRSTRRSKEPNVPYGMEKTHERQTDRFGSSLPSLLDIVWRRSPVSILSSMLFQASLKLLRHDWKWFGFYIVSAIVYRRSHITLALPCIVLPSCQALNQPNWHAPCLILALNAAESQKFFIQPQCARLHRQLLMLSCHSKIAVFACRQYLTKSASCHTPHTSLRMLFPTSWFEGRIGV